MLPFNAAQQGATWNRILEELYELAPKVESTRPRIVWCEVRFSVLSAQADSTEKRWRQLVEVNGARLGLATDRATASLAVFSANQTRPIRRITAGNEVAFVAGLPLQTLGAAGVSEETILRLRWFGVHRLGQLKNWTLPHLQSQFSDAKTLWRLVEAGSSKADRRPVTTWRPPPTLDHRFVFQQPATNPAEWESALRETLRVLKSELNGRGALHLVVVVEVRGKPKAMSAKTLRDRISTAARLCEPVRAVLGALLVESDELETLGVRLSNLADESWQDSLFATQEKRVRALKDALRQLETRLPGAVRKLQARDVFSALPKERFELVPLDVESLAVPTLTVPAL